MTDLSRQIRSLKLYCTVVTLAAAVLVLAAFQAAPARQKFEQIDVQRINVVEPDGKLDMVITNKALLPDPIVGGKTFKRSGEAQPGMIFYNGSGDEDGGLVFGSNTAPGHSDAGAALLFDQYQQDQTVGIMYNEENRKRTAGLYVWDRPDKSVADLYDKYTALEKAQPGPARDKMIQQMRAAGDLGALRAFVGKNSAGDAVLRFADANGHNRLIIGVAPSGTASIQFLDESGKVVYSVAPPAGR